MNVNHVSPRLLLTDVPREDTELAGHARTALCAADEGVLTLGMLIAPFNPERVRVLDDDGDVLVICNRGGAIERAALAKQLALLTIESFATDGVRLRLSGRLLPHTAQGSHQQAHVCSTRTGVIVALRVERIEVGWEPDPVFRTSVSGLAGQAPSVTHSAEKSLPPHKRSNGARSIACVA